MARMYAEYDFEIVHRSSCKHGNIDAVSWVPWKQCGRESHAETEECNTASAAVRTPKGSYHPSASSA